MDNRKDKQLSQEIADLGKKARQLNSPKTFVEYSKCIRQIDKLKKQLTEVRTNKINGLVVKVISIGIKIGINIFITAMWWSHPMYEIPKSVTWPLGYILALPNQSGQTISTLAWTFMCNICIKRLVS